MSKSNGLWLRESVSFILHPFHSESVNFTESLDLRRNNHFEENSDFKKRITWLMRIDQNMSADPRKFRCAICEVNCQDHHGFQTHLSGQKHHKKVKL